MDPYAAAFDRAAEAGARTLAESSREALPRMVLLRIHLEALRAQATAAGRGARLNVADCTSPDGVAMSLHGRCVLFWRSANGLQTWRGAWLGTSAATITLAGLDAAAKAIALPDSAEALETLARALVLEAVESLLTPPQ